MKDEMVYRTFVNSQDDQFFIEFFTSVHDEENNTQPLAVTKGFSDLLELNDSFDKQSI